MKFACILQYFDNGKVRAFVRPIPAKKESSFTNNVDEDLYINVFETKEEAERFVAVAKKATTILEKIIDWFKDMLGIVKADKD